MTKEDLLSRLVENALDFLLHSVEEVEAQPKYSIVHFHAATELFLKARLLAEHWSLVVAKRQIPDWDKFVTGDFVSVSLEEAAGKLDKAVKSGLTQVELDIFKDITKHKNKTVHFFHEAHTSAQGAALVQSLAKKQLTAWYYLHRLIVGRRHNKAFEADCAGRFTAGVEPQLNVGRLWRYHRRVGGFGMADPIASYVPIAATAISAVVAGPVWALAARRALMEVAVGPQGHPPLAAGAPFTGGSR